MTAIALPPRFRIRPKLLLGVSLAVVVAGQLAGAIAGTTHLPRPASGTTTSSAGQVETADGLTGDTVADLALIDHNIRAWTANLADNDRDFLSATNLGLLYDARARLTGDVSDYQRAVDALNTALAIAPHDTAAQVMHARELAAIHDFAGALAEAQAIQLATPGDPQSLATIGDASLELGDYATAQGTYDQLAQSSPGAAVTGRLARLAFLNGDVAGATSLAAQAISQSSATGEIGPSAAWYSYLAGTIATSAGKSADALADYQAALALWPDSFLALGGEARAQAALGQTDAAIASYQAAIAVSPQPDALAALGDLYALAGNQTAAKQQYDTVEFIGTLAAINKQVYNRALALFWVNHGRNLDQALVLAQTELQTRKDIYGWDTYAWALLANGRPADADAAMKNALAQGTHDALLSYHAGMIANALGDAARARSLLQDALSLPGALDPLAASKASQALAALP